MGKCAIIRFAACAAFVFAASETLQAAELSHRWSFNGDYSDSVGGADAVKCGTYVSLYGGRVHMGYGACSHGTGYVDLGTNMLDTTTATIEIWARHDGVESWSRVFDYGADTANNARLQGQVCIASRGKVKKLCMEVKAGTSADVSIRTLRGSGGLKSP